MSDTSSASQRPVAPGTLMISSQKDEGPFLLEWIAFHRAIGFENILIFSNDCEDGSDVLLDAIADTGAITHVRAHPGPKDSALELVGQLAKEHPLYQKAKWACWLDCDEFLNVHAGDGYVANLISALGSSRGAFLSWRLFGDSGLARWERQQLAVECFVKAAPKGARVNNPVKAFFRTGHWIDSLYCHRPIFAPDTPLDELKFKDNDGLEVLEKLLLGTRKNGKPEKDNPNSERRNRLAQVNHYAVRTYDVFQLKRIRGAGSKPMGASPEWRGRRYGQHFWDKRNTNQRIDKSIQRHLPALKAELARLLDTPEISTAHDACCEAMTSRLQKIGAAKADTQKLLER